MSSTGCTRRAARPRSIPTNGTSSPALIPEAERGDLLKAYRKRLLSDDPDEQLAAAKAFAMWEGNVVTLLPNAEVIEDFAEPHKAIAISRIENHYMINKGWFEEGELLRGAPEAARAFPASSSRAATIAAPRRVPPGR